MITAHAASTAFLIALAAAAPAAEVPTDMLAAAPGPGMSSLLSKAPQGAEIEIQGRIQERTGASTYLISDETGSVSVEIPQALLTGGLALLPGKEVRVLGTIEFAPGGAARVEARQVYPIYADEGGVGGANVLIR